MELKEGIFIRTYQGIARIVEKPNISVVVWNDRKVISVDKNGYPVATSLNFFVFEDEITNASFNPVDLIEVGDYVNGYKIEKIQAGENYCYLLEDDDLWTLIAGYDCDGLTMPIKSIVTKEQFEAMKYVVERDTNE